MPQDSPPQRATRGSATVLCGVVLVLAAPLLLGGCSSAPGHPGTDAAQADPSDAHPGAAGAGTGVGAGADRPSADSLSGNPLTDALYRCITTKGWAVTLTDEGGIRADSSTIPEEQYSVYEGDMWDCSAEVRAEYPVDDTQMHLLYEAELSERDCLSEHGYRVSPAPSLQVFLDTYSTQPWSAMATSGVADRSETMPDEEWRSINDACPQPVPGTLG